MRKNTTWALVGAVALLVSPVAARAADPAAKATKLDPRLSLTPEAMKAQNEQAASQYQERLEAQKRTTPSLEYLHMDDATAKSTPRELEVRLEKYIDGAILYSTPIDKAQEAPMRKLGMFRDVSAKEQVSDRTIFEGRVYRIARVTGGVNWQQELGKTGTLKMDSMGTGGVAVGFKVKK